MSLSSVHTNRAQTNVRNLRRLLTEVMAQGGPPPLSERVREAREQAGLTQEEAARRLHMSLGGYAVYERTREPKPARAREIARAFSLPEDYFVTGAPTGSETEELRDRVERLERDVGLLTEIAAAIFELNKRAFRALGVKVDLPDLPSHEASKPSPPPARTDGQKSPARRPRPR